MLQKLTNCSLNRQYYNRLTGETNRSLVAVYEGNRLSKEGLKFFLDFGYVPGAGTLFEGIEVVYDDPPYGLLEDVLSKYSKIKGGDFNSIVRNGGALFNKTIEELFLASNRPVVLPLTSGLDSRMLLGGLLECTTANNLTAFTWGIPGSYDFEVSKKISRKFGIKHKPLDVTQYPLTASRLREFANATDCSVSLFDHWPTDWVKEIVKETGGAIWMGLLGGTLSGANFPLSFGEDPISHFLTGENRCSPLSSLSGALMGERIEMTDIKRMTQKFSKVDFDNLDVNFHHLDLIIPTKIHRHFDYVLPFTHNDLIGYFMHLPKEHRIFRKIFKEIIVECYPGLASFPTHRAGGFGLHVKGRRRIWLNRLRKRVKLFNHNYTVPKYLSVEDGLEYKTLSPDFVEQKLLALERRDLFLNNSHIDLLKKEFLGGALKRRNHSQIMGRLISLEIILELIGYDSFE